MNYLDKYLHPEEEHLGLLPVVGITGKAGSGKDTAARAIVEQGFCKIALADSVKRCAAEIYGYPVKNLWGPSVLRDCKPFGFDGPLARRVLQFLGTEFGRGMREDTWIVRLFREMDKIQQSRGDRQYYPTLGTLRPPAGDPTKPYVGFVVSDVRFDNEAEAIRRVGGIILKIERPGVDPSVPEHASEQGIRPELIDAIIVNDESIESLRSKVDYTAIEAHFHRKEWQ